MRQTVDTRMLHRGGIGTYLRNLLPFLNLEEILLKSPIFSLQEQIEYRRKIPPHSLFWSPHFNVPFFMNQTSQLIVTIHDVYHLDDSKVPFLKKEMARLFLRHAIQQAAHIITVSEFSKSRILHFFPRAKNKLSVIHPGADHLLAIEPYPFDISPPFFLAIGSKKKHKNLSFLKEQISPLVIVDRQDLPIENICWLYRNAEALIFPSLYEGWGFPPLEAMSLGCPVIASNAGSIPEACGEAALFFDPNSTKDLQKALALLPHQRKELITKGRAQAAKFRWKRAAEQHAAIFLENRV